MATEVYTTEEIRLLDGTEIEIRPLSIAKLKKFMRMWENHMTEMSETFAKKMDSEEDEGKLPSEADLTDAQLDTFIRMCMLGLETLRGERTDKKFFDYLEDVLDEHTIHRILKVTGGLDLKPGEAGPNLGPATTPVVGQN